MSELGNTALVGSRPYHNAQSSMVMGYRTEEILNLSWDRVDFDRHVAWLNMGTIKNGEGRGIPLYRKAVLALHSCQTALLTLKSYDSAQTRGLLCLDNGQPSQMMSVNDLP
jgi:hypothetical protein